MEPETPEQLKKLINNFEQLNNPGKDDYEAALKKTAEELNTGAGKLIHPVRLALSGVGGGPGLYDILYILGRDESITRINIAIDSIKIA